ncbi:MAG: hypothetical protein J7539_09760 [Niabella sp.]|nr:hypothetical protein [Niabella sp.]
MKKTMLFMTLAMLCLVSCGPSIYKATEFNTKVETHKTVALLPAAVSMRLRPNEMKKMSAEQLKDLEKSTGYDVQDKMYTWFLKRSQKLNYNVKIQDITETNALLKNAGIDYEALSTTQSDQLAKILGVDALLETKLRSDKPMSDGVALAAAFAIGFYGSTNQVETTVSVKDGSSGDLIWKYNYQANGTMGSSSTKLVDALMRNLSKKFPYAKK